ncbi:MAG TPA: hydroxymethylbilane synthase [Syntrophomonadaceae bacterium]|nr:hydroxymethylbilane synthase [Syntrophomonadaceae bacterium]
MKRKHLRAGTRGSLLARRQTSWVIERIRESYPELDIEEVIISTRGDLDTETPLPEIGEKGTFTRALEGALLNGEIDFAVHSLKDLPTEIPAGLALGGIPVRANPLDALVTPKEKQELQDLPPGSRIGTSSLRRAAQLRCRRPDLLVTDIRGNLDTRLRKLEEGRVDALVVAAAGLERMGWENVNYTLLSPDACLPAPGQGALAVEIRAEDVFLRELCERALDDSRTRQAVTAERAFLEALGGGCQVPVGAYGVVENHRLELRGIVISTDGTRFARGVYIGDPGDPRAAGRSLAKSLLEKGAKEILADVI